MIKLKYKIDRASLLENSDYDLSEFEEVEITLEITNGLTISFVNDKIVVNNNALFVDNNQKVEENLISHEEDNG